MTGPLPAARASVAAGWCLALSAVALATLHPVVLAAALGAVLLAAARGGVLAPVARGLARSLPFAGLIALVNALVVRDGVTVLLRGPVLPWAAALDLTLEPLLSGLLLGARALVVVGCALLVHRAVDADALLLTLRRGAARSGVAAALAVRLVPVLARDARRLDDARRAMPGVAPSRLALLRALTTGALDRATDVAATLELRGFGSGRRPPRVRTPWSRHDLAFAASALVLLGLAVVGGLGGFGAMTGSPRFSAPVDGRVLGAAALLALVAALPLAARRGAAR